MKKIITLTLLFFLFSTKSIWAHALWIETKPTGAIGTEQLIKIYYGEYSYNVIEAIDSDAFNKVNNYTIWLISPDGKKESLKPKAHGSFYQVSYTPTQNGVYTIELNNNQIDVIDYTQYDFGIFKTHYHSTTMFTVGTNPSETKASNPKGLVIQNLPTSSDSLKIRIEYKGEILKNGEVTISIADQWSKKVYTNENGETLLHLPWAVKYFIEVTKKEEVPGNYKGDDYSFIWHCATQMICL